MIDKSWPTQEQIDAAQGENRRWSCFDLSQCPHEVAQCVDAHPWIVTICVACGMCLDSTCTNPDMEWNEQGTLLRCTVCGVDGT